MKKTIIIMIFIICSTQVLADYKTDIDDALKYYYTLDTDGTDYVGTDDLSCTGGAHAAAQINDGYTFGGDPDRCKGDINNAMAGLGSTIDYTIYFWTSWTNNVEHWPLFSTWDAGWTDGTFIYTGAGGDAGKIYFGVRNSAGAQSGIGYGCSGLNNGAMHFVLCSRSNSGTNLTCYCDDPSAGPDMSSTGLTARDIDDATEPIWLGAHAPGSGWWLPGRMDEVGFLYGLAATGDQRNWIYNSGTGRQPPYGAVADILPPTIDDINCTSPDPDDTAEIFVTEDTTPTFSLITNETSNCYISDINSSYTNCTTTGGRLDHICTLPSGDALNYGGDFVWINCTDPSANEVTEDYEMFIPSCGCPGDANDWNINMSHNCNITSNCDIGVGNLNTLNIGNLYVNATMDVSKVSSLSAFLAGQTIWMQIIGIINLL